MVRIVRKAWVMKLKPGAEQDYRERHDKIWPELLTLMDTSGVKSFTIYRYGQTLFAYQEIDAECEVADQPDEVMRKWWASLQDLMECQSDGQPERTTIEEIFHHSS